MTRVVLVTGAHGFVGRHVLAEAQARGVDAIAADVDLLEAHAIGELVRRVAPDAVIHLAERRATDSGRTWAALDENLRMARHLIESLAATDTTHPLLLAGSAAQYGLAGPAPLSELSPTIPISAHGAVKCVVERACTAPPLAEGVRVIWTRSFNHIGPGQGGDAPAGAWARQVVAAEAVGGGPIRTGRLDVVRDFLDVRDVARAYLDLVATDAEGVVNVCSGRGVELREVADKLADLASVPVAVQQSESLFRRDDPPVVIGNPRRLQELTGWAPRISLEQSLSDTLAWVRAEKGMQTVQDI